MAVIRNLVVKIGADISGLSKGLKNAQTQLNKMSKNLGKIGSTLTKNVTVPLIALGTLAVKTSASFEQSMANAASVSGATAEELDRMTAIAREMGNTTVFSASDAADAMYYMASAGYKVEQMADAIQPILNLAAATQNDLAETTDVVIAKKGAGRYADEWMPNMMSMFENGIISGIPKIQGAVQTVVGTISAVGSVTAGVDSGDTTVSGDILNGLLSAMTMTNGVSKTSSDQPVNLNIDGQAFARLIMPNIIKEFKRNGIVLNGGMA